MGESIVVVVSFQEPKDESRRILLLLHVLVIIVDNRWTRSRVKIVKEFFQKENLLPVFFIWLIDVSFFFIFIFFRFPHLHQASDLINIHHQPPPALFKFLHLHLAEQNSNTPNKHRYIIFYFNLNHFMVDCEGVFSQLEKWIIFHLPICYDKKFF